MFGNLFEFGSGAQYSKPEDRKSPLGTYHRYSGELQRSGTSSLIRDDWMPGSKSFYEEETHKIGLERLSIIGKSYLTIDRNNYQELLSKDLSRAAGKIYNKPGGITQYEAHYLSNVNKEDLVYLREPDIINYWTKKITPGNIIRVSSKEDKILVDYVKKSINLQISSKHAFANPQIQAVLGNTVDEDGESGAKSRVEGFSIPSTLGPSYFHSIAKYNAGRSLGGRTTVSYQDDEGMAAGAYKLSYYQQTDKILANGDIPEYIRRFDRQLTTPGLGTYVNQYFMQHGFDRVYKEEFGAVPSFFGLMGAILDKSIGYNSTDTLDAYARRTPMTKDASIPIAGPLENLFTNTANFITQTTSAVLTYLAVGIPVSVVMSHLSQSALQMTLDKAVNNIGVGDLDIKPGNIARKAAQLLTVGSSFTGITDSTEFHKTLGEAIDYKSDAENLSRNPGFLTAYNNIFMRRRGSMMYDNILKPFILEVINPYSPYVQEGTQRAYKNSKFTNLLDKLDKFSTAISDEISITKHVDEVSGEFKYVYNNVGYSRQKTVAKAFDDVAAHLPINPLNWGLMKNFTNPKKGSFISLGEIFSLSGLVETFNDVMYGNSFSELTANFEHRDTRGGMYSFMAKLKTVIAAPFSLTGESLGRFIDSRRAINPLLESSKRLRKMEAELIEAGALFWDGAEYKAVARFDQSPDKAAKYIHELLRYEEAYENLPAKTRLKMGEKAEEFFSSQKVYSQTLNNSSGRYLTNPFLKNRGKLATAAFLTVGIGMAFNDLFNSNQGVSILTQIENNLNANYTGVGATAEWKAGPIWNFDGGYRYAASAAFSLGAAAGAAWIAEKTQGITFDMRELHFTDQEVRGAIGNGLTQADVTKLNQKGVIGVLAKVESAVTGKQTQLGTSAISAVVTEELMENELKIRNVTSVRAKGNFLRNFAFAFFGIQAAREISRQAAAGGLSVAGWLGQVTSMWGGTNPFHTNKFTVGSDFRAIADLENYRNVVLDKVRSGEASTIERLAAYRVGALSRSMSILGGGKTVRSANSASLVTVQNDSGQTQVIAKQAPLPFIQFFEAETIKKRTYNADGSVKDGGISTWTAGIQSGPAMGMTLSFGLPIAYDWRGKGGAFGTGVIYSDEKENILNYLKSIGTLTSSAIIGGLVTMTFLNVAELVTRLPGLSNINGGFKQGVETIKDVLNAVYTLSEYAAEAPKWAARTFIGIGKADYQLAQQLTDPTTFSNFMSAEARGKKPNRFRPTFTNVLRGGIGGGIGYHLADWIVGSSDSSRTKEENEVIHKHARTVGALAGFAVGYSTDPLLKMGKESVDRMLDSKGVEAITRAVAPITKFLAPLAKFRGVGAITFAAGMLATDSRFGIAVNMDTDEEGNRDTTKQIMTAALYSATITIPVVTLANVGKSPMDVVKRYYDLSRATGWDPTRSLRLALLNREIKAYSAVLNESVVAGSYKKATSETRAALTVLETHMSSTLSNRLIPHTVDPTVMDNLSTVLTSREYLRYSSQRGPFYSRMFMKAPTVIGLTALAGTVLLGVVGLMAGGKGENVIRSGYDVMDQHGFTRPIADVLRLITLRDGAGSRKGYELFTDSAGMGRGSKPIMGTKLIAPYNPKGQGIEAAMQAMQQDFSMGPMNSFQQVTPGFGITFRPSEDGGRVSGYVQIQSMGQDMSTSVYSMAPSFLFAQAANGRGDLGIIVRESVRGVGIKGASASVAANIYELTGTLPSLEAAKRRRFTQITLSSLDSKLAGDRLLTLMLTDRQKRMSQLSYQPLASIISRASNLREPSLSSMFGSKVNISRPMDSINPNMSKEDKEILSNPSILKAMYIQLLNPLNKVDLISVRKSLLDPDTNTKSVQDTGMSETSEWIEYTGNNIGNTPFQRPGIFKSIEAAKSNFENFMNKLPFGGVLTTAFYFSLVVSGVVGAVSAATALMTKGGADALTDLVDKNRNLFGDVHKQGISSEMFRIEKIAKGDTEYIVRKGNSYFKISPDSQTFHMQTSNAQLEGVQRRIQGGTDALWEDLHLLTNDTQTKEMFDPGSPSNAGIGRSTYVNQVSGVYTSKLGSYVDKLAEELKSIYQDLGVTFSDESFLEVRKELITRVENTIATEISNNFSKEGALLRRYRGLDLEGSSQYLSKMVLKDIKYFFDGIRNNLLGLQSTEFHMGEVLIKEAEDAIRGGTINSPLSSPSTNTVQSSTVSKAAGFEGISAPSSAVPRKLPKASASLQWLKSAGKAVSGLFAFKDTMDALDIYGSYARLAGSYDSKETTEAQRKVLGLHAAQTSGTFLSVAGFMAASNIAMSWLGSTFALTGSGLFGTSVTLAGGAAATGGAATMVGGVGVAATAPVSIPVLGLVALAATVIGVGFAMRKQIGEGLHAVSQTRLWKGLSNTVENGLQSMNKAGAGLIMGGANNVNKWSGGLISKGTFVSSLGMTQAAILIGLIAAPALLASGAIASIGIGYIGVSAAIGLAGGLIGGSIPGFNKTMGGFAAWAQETAAQIPMIGGFLATPLGMIYSRKDIQFNGPGSPIYAASVDQAIQYESKKYLTASTDASGQRSRALFTSPNQYGSKYEASDPWAAQSNLRPRGVMDPMIDKEIAVRAQYYNQSIIGQRIWREIIKNAANYPALLQLEKDKYRNDPTVRAYQSTVKAKIKKEGESIAQAMAASDTQVQKQAYAAATQVTGKSGTPAQKTKKAILVDSKRIANADLRAKTQSLASVIGFNILHETDIKVIKEGNTTTVKEVASPDNDMYYAITAGRVSHLPAYMSV